MSTLLITHPDCLDHLTPLGHPERPERLRAIESALEIEKFQSLARVEAPRAPLNVIALCHPRDYITQISEAIPTLGIVHLDADTSMSASRCTMPNIGVASLICVMYSIG